MSHIEAEDYSQQSGIQTTSGGSAVGYIEDGDYIMFDNVTFSSAVETLNARVASNTSGGTMSIHLNNLNASAVCSVPVSNTGGWTSWVIESAAGAIPAGTYGVYARFSGGYLFDVDWIQFAGSPENEQSAYEGWLADNGITANTNYLDDADFDGVENLLEFALDFTHGSADAAVNTLALTSGAVSLSYTDKPDLDVKLFYSTNLVDGWVEASPSLTPLSMSADTVYYSFDTDQPSCFFRWEITAP